MIEVCSSTDVTGVLISHDTRFWFCWDQRGFLGNAPQHIDHKTNPRASPQQQPDGLHVDHRAARPNSNQSSLLMGWRRGLMIDWRRICFYLFLLSWSRLQIESVVLHKILNPMCWSKVEDVNSKVGCLAGRYLSNLEGLTNIRHFQEKAFRLLLKGLQHCAALHERFTRLIPSETPSDTKLTRWPPPSPPHRCTRGVRDYDVWMTLVPFWDSHWELPLWKPMTHPPPPLLFLHTLFFSPHFFHVGL